MIVMLNILYNYIYLPKQWSLRSKIKRIKRYYHLRYEKIEFQFQNIYPWDLIRYLSHNQ